MNLYLDDFKLSLEEVVEILFKNDISYVIASLNLGSNEVEKERIITALENFLSALTGDTETLGFYNKKEEERRKLKREYGNKPVNKTVAIAYTNLPKSTFEKKVSAEIKIMIDGRPYFKIDDLDKISRLIINSGKPALCIEKNFCFEVNRRGFFPFSTGKFYKIVDEDEHFKYIFNDEWNVTLRIGKNSFSNYFQVKEDLESLLSQFND